MDWEYIITASVAGILVGIPVTIFVSWLLYRLFPFRPG